MQCKAALLAIQMRKGSLPPAPPQTVVKRSERAEDLSTNSSWIWDAKTRIAAQDSSQLSQVHRGHFGYDANGVRENLDWRD